MAGSVFVSGATGFIAQHIVKQLIEEGYTVVGSVRSTEKGEALKKNVGDKFSYEIVKDIQEEGAFNEALKKHPEVTVVLHTASPFHFKATDPEKELLLPAVHGTKNALKAVAEFAPQVKTVVITSSYAAIAPADKEIDPTFTITEETWNNISWEDAKANAFSGYRGSKAFAEKAAWEFVKTEKPNFVLSIVNPVFVFGPQAFDSEIKAELNTSAEFINNILKQKPDEELAAFKGAFIDVRDVSKAHILAFEKPELAEQRLLLANGRFAAQDVADILNTKFKDVLGGKIPVGTPGSGPEVTSKLAKIDNSKTKKSLGFEFASLEKTVADTVQQILDVNGGI
ncbi:putative NADPH-dependent methylglyoxal reductase Grp2p [[Candida] railenensis]|uniref:NADPH-dependent methylglyoxal reductase Grp2p n=1 Tax=[Candida] railenensis TaxID=45579 RepID=A0A9P0VVW1_9ASCO|nr:putative NADPH-dependent methylglyoxal reductase Grp2p [[Candida] railenensis]